MRLLLKLDLHVHTKNSPDASTDPGVVGQIAKSRGLDGVAITEHDLCSPIKSSEILIIPGIEVSSREGHVLALGANETVPKGLPARDTIELLRKQSCVTVIPHPYDRSSPSIDPLHLRCDVHAIETINSSVIPFSSCKKKAETAARILELSMVAGSDSHIPSTIGDAFTLVETSSPSLASVLESIRSGRTTPCGSATSVKNRLRTMQTTLSKKLSTL